MIEPDKLQQLAKQKENSNRKFLMRLKIRMPKDLDAVVQQLHESIFSKVDCLDCANCCKRLGPRISEKDIERLAKFTGNKKQSFVKTYLNTDEDGDYVFQNMPCPFLLPDNYCSVYEVRPKACSDYPHTDRRKFHQIFNLTLKNTFTCPAVFQIVEELKKTYY